MGGSGGEKGKGDGEDGKGIMGVVVIADTRHLCICLFSLSAAAATVGCVFVYLGKAKDEALTSLAMANLEKC